MNRAPTHKRQVTFTFDPDAKAAYFTFSEHAVAKTIEKNDYVSLDLDRSNNLVGLEIIFPQNARNIRIEQDIQACARKYSVPELSKINFNKLREAVLA